MTALWVVLGAAFITAMLYAAVSEASPVYALVLSLAAVCVIMLRLSAAVQSVAQGVLRLAQRADGTAFACLAKCAGILLLTDYVRTLCDEAGAQSLAWCTGFAGRCLVLTAAWPLLSEVCGRIWELTG